MLSQSQFNSVYYFFPDESETAFDGVLENDTSVNAFSKEYSLPYTHGQTFCDLQTLLQTFFGFPGAGCNKICLIFWVEMWTFVGL